MENTIPGLILFSIIIFLVLYFWSFIWAYKDAENRGKNGWAVALLMVLVFWPLSLLFWVVVRPEKIKQSVLQEKTLKQSFLSKNFKAMPWLLKILFIFSALSLIGVIKDFIQFKPITFSFFNSGFPNNYPVIWYIYLLAINLITIFVYLKRSYKLLIVYLTTTTVLTIPWMLNNMLIFKDSLPGQNLVLVISLVLFYLFSFLLIIYFLRQKHYFNRP